MGNLMSDEEVRETNEQWCIKIDEMIYDEKKSFDDINYVPLEHCEISKVIYTADYENLNILPLT